MTMRRFQMLLDAELDAALEQRASLEAVSKAELLRRFARTQLGVDRAAVLDDPLWEMLGADDGADDDGEHVDIDDVLYGTPR